MVDLVPYVGAVLVVIGALLLLGFRRRILLRIGVRNFLRRKSQVALAVAGLFVGASIISGALVMGDSFDFTVRDLVLRSTYLVDEIVWLQDDRGGTRSHMPGPGDFLEHGKRFFSESVYANLSTADMPHVQGVEPRIAIAASVRNVDSGFLEPTARLLAFEPDRDFDTFLLGGGVYDGADLPAGHVLVNAKLEARLDARKGQTLRVSTEIGNLTLRVHTIVSDGAKGGFLDQPNLFMRLSDAQASLALQGRINAIFVSNIGGVRHGAEATDEAVAELEVALPPGLSVDPVKKLGLDAAKDSISFVTQIFSGLSLFTVIAGLLLIMNIFVVLAEERKGEMGMSRALGMRRLHLTETFVFEGLLYALAASAIGAVAGLAVAGVLILALGALLAGSGGFFFAPLFHFETGSLVIAFAVGFLVTMAVVALASWRVSRLNIVRALRNIPEPPARRGTRRQWTLGAVLTLLGLVATWRAIVQESSLLAFAGPSLLAYGVAGLAQRVAGTRAAYTGAALVVGGWMLYPPRLNLYVAENEFPIGSFVGASVLLVLSAVVAVMLNSKALLVALTRLGGWRKKLRPVIKTAVSYPMARKGRTGLSLAMFALVVFIITLISMFAAIFFGNVEQFTRNQSGGYDIGARATLRPPGGDFYADFRNAPVSGKVERYAAFNGSFALLWRGSQEPIAYPVHGIPAYFATQSGFPFDTLLPEYTTPEKAWEALAANPNLAVFDGGVASGFGRFSLRVGDRIEVTNLTAPTGERRTFTVIGILLEFFTPGMFIGEVAARDGFGARVPTGFLFGVTPGSSPAVVARELERDLWTWGLDATVFRELIEQGLKVNLSFIRILQAFVALGLVVGVAGLGVVTMRNVVERKNEIGTLRAIGFRRGMVLRYLLIENSFVSLLGILLGIALGITFSYVLFLGFFRAGGAPFVVPWYDLGAIGFIAYASGLLSTLPPSRKASRMPPAEALRMVE